jgi:hypothetical protein
MHYLCWTLSSGTCKSKAWYTFRQLYCSSDSALLSKIILSHTVHSNGFKFQCLETCVLISKFLEELMSRIVLEPLASSRVSRTGSIAVPISLEHVKIILPLEINYGLRYRVRYSTSPSSIISRYCLELNYT